MEWSGDCRNSFVSFSFLFLIFFSTSRDVAQTAGNEMRGSGSLSWLNRNEIVSFSLVLMDDVSRERWFYGTFRKKK